ncbi:MAG TPA: helix-turn-helix domain-containing protein [Lacipirellulaceae bacterium]
MVDQLTEIPLPGRTAVPHANGRVLVGETGFRLPAFIAGPENRLVAATMDLLLHQADSVPAHPTHQPTTSLPFVLSLFGASGVGKTHLSLGLVRHWQARRGEDSAEYVTAQDFRRLLNDSMSTNSVIAFRDRFRKRELIAIDELHQLPNDDYLHQELRSALDALEEFGGMVVVTSTRPVTALPNLSPDLRSRLASGLMLQLASPGMAARMRIVQQFSAALGRPLSDEVVQRLAAGLRGTASRLIGAIFELCAALQNNAHPAADPVSQLFAARDCERPTPRNVVAVVARHYGVPQRLLKSNSRKQRLVRARATAIYLARELCRASYEQIGQALGGRDHTTIMHNFRKVERERQHDFALQETLADLRRILVSR